jgi:nicotinamide riboside kinase
LSVSSKQAKQNQFELMFSLNLGRRVFLLESDWAKNVYGDCKPFLSSMAEAFWVKNWSEALAQTSSKPVIVTGDFDEISGLSDRIGALCLPIPNVPKDWVLCAPSRLNRKRIAVVGPESTGKTTLCEQNALGFNLLVVGEYIRFLLDQHGRRTTVFEDVEAVIIGQHALEEAVFAGSSCGVLCDTVPLQSLVWSDILFGKRPKQLLKWLAQRAKYDGYLITMPDITWSPDPQRCLPDGGMDFFERISKEVSLESSPREVVSGHGESRRESFAAALTTLLTSNETGT